MATDPVLRPLTRGPGPDLRGMQRTGDGQSNPGAGIGSARSMTGAGAVDASTAGGLREDTAAKYAHLPAPLSALIRRNMEGDPDPQGGRD